MFAIGLTGHSYSFPDDDDVKLAVGGEGTIIDVDNNHVAKIYHSSILLKDSDLEQKILYMISHPPSRIVKYMAWPTDALYSNGAFIGFVMNKLSGFSQLGDLYSYSISKQHPEDLKLSVAYNLASMVSEIHNAGYVIGDFNPKNIGYNKNGNVCFYDNDSFQFTDNNGFLHKCCVSFPGYVAPEILDMSETKKREYLKSGKDPNKVQLKDLENPFSLDTDRFALSVHVFKLLFNGFDPYSSIDVDSVQSSVPSNNPSYSSSRVLPSTDQNVSLDNYCFKPGRAPLSLAVPDVTSFPKYVTDLFLSSFTHISTNSHRPSAQDWIRSLDRYSRDVKRCAAVSDHIYWKSVSECPYCSANEAFSNQVKNYNRKPAISHTNPIVAQAVKVGFRANAPTSDVQKFYDLYWQRKDITLLTVSDVPDVLKLDETVVKLLKPYKLDQDELNIYNFFLDEYNRLNLLAKPVTVNIRLPMNNIENNNSSKIIVSCSQANFKQEYDFGQTCTFDFPRFNPKSFMGYNPELSIVVDYLQIGKKFKYHTVLSYNFGYFHEYLANTSNHLDTVLNFDIIYVDNPDDNVSSRWQLVNRDFHPTLYDGNMNYTKPGFFSDRNSRRGPTIMGFVGIAILVLYFAFVYYMWDIANAAASGRILFFDDASILIVIGVILTLVTSFIGWDDLEELWISLFFTGGGVLLWGAATVVLGDQYQPLLEIAIVSTVVVALNPIRLVIKGLPS